MTRASDASGQRPLNYPAAERNKQPILEALQPLLSRSRSVLEIGAGTGQHAAHFAANLSDVVWHPTDADPGMIEAMNGRFALEPIANVAEPVLLDVHDRPWPVGGVDAVVCINLIHIAPWSATEQLMLGAAEALTTGQPLVLYGPFFVDGRPAAPSNLQFDSRLRSQDARWGVRHLTDVGASARTAGLELDETIALPANNLVVVFRRF